MPEYLTDDIDFAAYLKDTDAKTKVKPAADFVQDAKTGCVHGPRLSACSYRGRSATTALNSVAVK